MTVWAFMGMWEDGLTLSVRPEDEGMFLGLGPMEAEMMGPRSVCLAFTPGGVQPTYAPMSRETRGGRAVSYYLPVRLDALPCRFELHLVELREVGEDMLVWDLPPYHELPWPDVRSTQRYRPETLPGLASRELETRLRSALETGGPDLARAVTKGCPDWVRGSLRGHAWSGIVSRLPGADERGALQCT